jgi:cbb3-type cytochrome oxidase maturation protein
MSFNDFMVYATLFGSIVFFGGAAVLALAWAVRDGQFENFHRGARSIFDPDEPIGEMTDAFPGEKPLASKIDD